MPSSIICHNYVLLDVTWFDVDDKGEVDLLCLSLSEQGGS